MNVSLSDETATNLMMWQMRGRIQEGNTCPTLFEIVAVSLTHGVRSVFEVLSIHCATDCVHAGHAEIIVRNRGTEER